MNIGRSLSNFNGYLKNTVSKELRDSGMDLNSSFSLSLDQLYKVLSIRSESELKYFLLDTNLPEFDIDYKLAKLDPSSTQVKIQNVEMLQSRVEKKLKLYYSFDDNDLLEIEVEGLTKEKKREVLFKHKIILDKIYTGSWLTKEDLQAKLQPNNFIESGFIAEDDDFEKTVLNDLATLAKYPIRHQKIGEFLRPIILNKENLVVLKSKKDNSERVYISSVATSLGTYGDPFRKDEQLDSSLFERTVYLFSSTGEEIVICGILASFIHDYAFFEGKSVRYRLEPEYMLKFFNLDEGGPDTVSIEFFSYEELFKQSDKRCREIIGKFSQFEWMIKSYKDEMDVSQKKLDKLLGEYPDLDSSEGLEVLIENVEYGFQQVPEDYIIRKYGDDAEKIDPSTIKNNFLILMKDIKKTMKEREFSENMIKYLSQS